MTIKTSKAKPREGKIITIVQPIAPRIPDLEPTPDPRPLIFDLKHFGKEVDS